MAGLRLRSCRRRLRDRRLLRRCWQGLFRQRLAHSGKGSGSRFWPHSNRLVGTEARQPRSSASHPPLSIAVCAITISNEEDKPQIYAEKRRSEKALSDPRFSAYI